MLTKLLLFSLIFTCSLGLFYISFRKQLLKKPQNNPTNQKKTYKNPSLTPQKHRKASHTKLHTAREMAVCLWGFSLLLQYIFLRLLSCSLLWKKLACFILSLCDL